MNIKGLLIDIDDTLIRFRRNTSMTTSSLMNVLKQAGHELGGLTLEESTNRVEWIKKTLSGGVGRILLKNWSLTKIFFGIMLIRWKANTWNQQNRTWSKVLYF